MKISFNTSSQLNGITKNGDLLLVVPMIKIFQVWKLFLSISNNRQIHLHELKNYRQTGNDSTKFNYNGISQFSSVRNRSASTTLDKLGFKSSGTNLNLRYANNSIIADSLFGITYNISETYPNKYGFHPSYQKR